MPAGTRSLTLALLAVMQLATAVDGRQQVRDAGRQTPQGTATISGIVTSTDTSPQPMRRAVVTITGADLPVGRSAITDDNGRFTIARLPAGRVMVAAAKRGYLNGAYGATRTGRPGTPVLLLPDQVLDVTIRIARGAVVTGRIRDDRGEPVEGLRVFAIDARRPVVPQPTEPFAGGTTDDRGIYRIHSLAPGEYLVAATPTSSVVGDITRRLLSENDAVLARLKDRALVTTGLRGAGPAASSPAPAIAALAPVFHPGTASMASATRIALAAGDEREGIDFAMSLVPVTTIEGAIASPDGTLPGSIDMSITPGDTLRFFALASVSPQLVKAPGTDARFVYTGITPGPYVIRVRANREAPASAAGPAASAATFTSTRSASVGNADTLYAIETFDVSGPAVTGLTVRLHRGSQFSGRVVFDGASIAAPADLTNVRVTVEPPAFVGSSTARGTVIGATFVQARYADVRADGTFTIVGLAPGSYRIQVTVPPGASEAGQAWQLRSGIVAGRDVLDTTLDIAIGADVSGAVLTMSDRRSDLSGTLQTPAGLPAQDYFVIAFPADPALRVSRSRRMRSTRPATDGLYHLADLPPGDYLVVALDDLDPNDWERADFLAEIAPAGVKVTIGEGDRKVQDLRIVGGR